MYFLRDFWYDWAPPPQPTQQPHFLNNLQPLMVPLLPFSFSFLHLPFLHLPNLFSQILDSEAISGSSDVKAVIYFFSGIDKHTHYKCWTRNCQCLGALTNFWWRGIDESDHLQAPAILQCIWNQRLGILTLLQDKALDAHLARWSVHDCLEMIS